MTFSVSLPHQEATGPAIGVVIPMLASLGSDTTHTASGRLRGPPILRRQRD